MIVIPAVIPTDFEDLRAHLIQIKGIVRAVQIDITDGRLTQSPSWPYVGDSGEFKEILGQERGIPFWENFEFEIDLMVLNPAHEYEQWIDAGCSRIVFHYKESEAATLKDIMQKTKDRGVEVSLALHISDPVSIVDDFKDITDSIQLMGIERIGFQGEPFDERVLAQIRESKKAYPEMNVSVDGGVNTDTAKSIAEAGADRLIIGSAIFGAFDIAQTIGYFKSLN